jgi:uncharacterized damage-inducible protein DinB
MTDSTKEHLTIYGLEGYEPEIGRLLWMLEDSRRHTKRLIAKLGDADLDWAPTPQENSIGALLYHIAGVEAGWLYEEVLQQPSFTPEMIALFPEDYDNGHLAHARGTTLETHLQRLDAVRADLLAAFRGMSVAEFRRERDLPDYAVTPEWVLYHLLQHEDEHRAEIAMLRWLPTVCHDGA